MPFFSKTHASVARPEVCSAAGWMSLVSRGGGRHHSAASSPAATAPAASRAAPPAASRAAPPAERETCSGRKSSPAYGLRSGDIAAAPSSRAPPLHQRSGLLVVPASAVAGDAAEAAETAVGVAATVRPRSPRTRAFYRRQALFKARKPAFPWRAAVSPAASAPSLKCRGSPPACTALR